MKTSSLLYAVLLLAMSQTFCHAHGTSSSKKIPIPKTNELFDCSVLADDELCNLVLIKNNNALLVNHSSYFQNAAGEFGRIYELGVDAYTVSSTPRYLNYHIYSAVGYGTANIQVLARNAQQGFVIIDAGTNPAEVDVLITAFQDRGFLPQGDKLPLSAIIYTHNHIDHSGGSARWIERSTRPRCPAQNDGNDGIYYSRQNCVEIIAHKKATEAVINTAMRSGQQLDPRSIYTMGGMSVGGAINIGIGAPGGGPGSSYELPSKTLSEFLDFRIDGMQLSVEYAPSETNDEIVIFVPDKNNQLRSPPTNPDNLDGVLVPTARSTPQSMGPGAMFCAEAIQGPPAFPNLYSLRGTTFRNPLDWYQSVDMIRLFESWCLVGTHGVPIMKKTNVHKFLTSYRDAVQYVHDQTLRRIRQGYIPDELVTLVDKIPDELISGLDSIADGLPTTAETPIQVDPRDHLRSMYGTVPQGVRAIYFGYVGWNQGDPTYFKPLPPTQRANNYIRLFGGPCAVLDDAQAAYTTAVNKIATDENWKDGLRWTAEVLSYVLSASNVCQTHVQAARALKAKALLQLSSSYELNNDYVLQNDLWTLSSNWRNWLVMGGQELAFRVGGIRYPYSTALSSTTIQQGLPPRYWVQHWCWRFNIENGAGLDQTTFGWNFEPNDMYWGSLNLKYLLQVSGKVVRFIGDETAVNAIWNNVDLAVSISYASFVELVNRDRGGVDFGSQLGDMIRVGNVTRLKGSVRKIENFYGSVHFDGVPTQMPNIVERPVPTEPLMTTGCACGAQESGYARLASKEFCGSVCSVLVGVVSSVVLFVCVGCFVYARKNREYDRL